MHSSEIVALARFAAVKADPRNYIYLDANYLLWCSPLLTLFVSRHAW